MNKLPSDQMRNEHDYEKPYGKAKLMWSVGIKSGVITVLGLIVYGPITEAIRLQHPFRGTLEYVVLALGIYSGHYYYKVARKGSMTYKEGLQIGLIVASFTGMINGSLLYLYTQRKGYTLIKQLINNLQNALKQMGTGEHEIQEIIPLIQRYITPASLLFGTIIGTTLIGFIFSLFIAALSKSAPKNTGV